jgi:hypothetical protein
MTPAERSVEHAKAAYLAISSAFAEDPAGEHSMATLFTAAVKLHDRKREAAAEQPTVRGESFVFDYRAPQQPAQGLGELHRVDWPAPGSTRPASPVGGLARDLVCSGCGEWIASGEYHRHDCPAVAVTPRTMTTDSTNIPVKYPKDWPRGWK